MNVILLQNELTIYLVILWNVAVFVIHQFGFVNRLISSLIFSVIKKVTKLPPSEKITFLHEAIKHHVTVTSVTHDVQNLATLGETNYMAGKG